jgi:hypothetical protein
MIRFYPFKASYAVCLKLIMIQIYMLRFTLSILFLLTMHVTLYAQRAYTWNIAGNGSIAAPTNWLPQRNSPNNGDTLIFNGGTRTINGLSTSQTIGRLVISGGANITLVGSTSGNSTLTLGTSIASDVLNISAGSRLNLTGVRSGGSEFTFTLNTANVVGIECLIYGTLSTTFESGRPATIGVFTKAANATIRFFSESVYQHNVNGSSIPQSIWNSNSTCLITGLTTTAPTGLNQNFGHFTYNCTGHSGIPNFNSQLTSIAGNFTVLNAGQKQGTTRTLNGLALASTTDATINIGGDLIIDNTGSDASWLIMSTGDADITMNIGGNFTMTNSGGNAFVYFDYKWGTTTAMGSLVVNVAGNLSVMGGANFDMGFQANAYSAPAELRISGNLTADRFNSITTTSLNLANGKIIFQKTGLQTIQEITAGAIRYVDFLVKSGSTLESLSNLFLWEISSLYPLKSGDFVVESGATLDLNTFTLQNYRDDVDLNNAPGFHSTFVLNSNAHLITARPQGVFVPNNTGGAISAAVFSRTFSSGANYTYDGTVLQKTGIFATTPVANTVNNLTVNNAAGIATTGVSLQQHFNVNGTLNLQQGHFTTFLDSLITINAGANVVGGSDNSFVNGPMKKIGNSNFTFPVGKLQVANIYNPSGFAGGWRPFGISNVGSTVTDGYTAEFFLNDANLIGVVNSPGIPQLLRVSPCEYWGLRRDATNSLTNISVTLHWKPKSDCNAGFYISNPAGVTAALSTTGAPLVHNRLNSWDKHSGTGSGTATDGSVTYNNVDYTFISSPFASAVTYQDFTPFSIGSTNISQAPLPVELRSFTVSSKDKQVQLDWLVKDNDLVKNYTIERSRDGKQFESLRKISAIANLETASYNDKDMMPFSGWSYYRLKITDYEGKDFYSSVQKVWIGQSGSWLQVSPKPAKDRLLVNLAVPERISELSIVNNMGQLMIRETNIKSLNQIDISRLMPGMYYLRVIGKDGIVTDNFIKQ